MNKSTKSTSSTAEKFSSSTNSLTDKILLQVLEAGERGVWDWDITNNKVTWTETVYKLHGLKQGDFGGRVEDFSQFIHPDDRKEMQRLLQEAITKGIRFNNDFRVIHPNGTIHWLSTYGIISSSHNGKPSRMTGITYDITAKKRLEENLLFLSEASRILSSSLDYNDTLQNVAQIAVPHIADWCTVSLIDENNFPQQVALSHVDPKKIKWAYKLQREYPPDPDAPTGVPNVIRTGKPEMFPHIPEELLVRAAKDEKHLKIIRELGLVSAMTVPILQGNKAVGAISFVSAESEKHFTPADLSMAEEVASRAALAIENSQLYNQVQIMIDSLEKTVAVRTNALNILNTELKRSNRELQDFAYVASHDLQEPLRKIQAFGNLLDEEYGELLQKEGKDYLERMRNAASRMRGLIDDLLSFSRVATKGQAFVEVDLSEILNDVLLDLEVRIQETKAEIHVKKLPKIDADPFQMRQLFQNLLSNALKFHKKGRAPIITVSAKLKTNGARHIPYCTLTFEDNGIGFNEKYIDRIFTVFQRLHGKESYEGTGIGLAVCRKIVERHGGSITATSKLGVGSVFSITIPAELRKITEHRKHSKQKEVKAS